MRNLRVCKQRFDSTAKPLGRAVVHWEPLLATAMQIVNVRGSRSVEGQAALVFLELVDEEVALQLGLLADASDEALRLTRSVDKESSDMTRFPRQLSEFVHRLELMYQEDGICWDGGFAKRMLQQLSKPMVVWIASGPKTLGGEGSVTTELKAQCVSRMRNWQRLLVETIRAEFPDFEICHHINVFHIAPRHHQSPEKRRADGKSLMVLARFLSVEENAVVDDYNRCWPIASLISTSDPDAPAHDVWRRASDRAQLSLPSSFVFCGFYNSWGHSADPLLELNKHSLPANGPWQAVGSFNPRNSKRRS